MSAIGGLGGAASGAAMGAAFGPIGAGVGALAGGLLGAFGPDGSSSGSSGGSPSRVAGGVESPTNQIVNLDVTNNNVGAPISINIGGTQSVPDGSIGNLAGVPVSQPVALAEYGSLAYNSRMVYTDELGNPIFHDGGLFGSELAPGPTAETGSLISSALPFVLAGLAVLLILKRRSA